MIVLTDEQLKLLRSRDGGTDPRELFMGAVLLLGKPGETIAGAFNKALQCAAVAADIRLQVDHAVALDENERRKQGAPK